MGYLFVGLAVCSTSFGLMTYKKYMLNKQQSFLFITVALFLLAPVFNFIALKSLTIDVVYMATSLNGLVVLYLSRCFLKEKTTKNQFYGALLVFIGVTIYMV